MAKRTDAALGENRQLADKTEGAVTKAKHGGARPNAGGRREGSGRKKGVPNKLTADVKGMILEALKAKGGAKYLEQQANANPVAFMGLIGKVLPLTLAGDSNQPIQIKFTWGNESDR